MNAIERFTAVLQGKLPDRVPIIGNLLEQGAKELGLSIEEYYSNGEYVAEGQLRMRKRYGYDNLAGFFYAGKDAEMLGCRKIIFSKIGPPNVGHFVIQKDQDIEKLEIPEDLTQLPAFEEIAKCISILKREAGGIYLIGGSVVGSFSLPALLMGIDRWLELLLTGPESLRKELLLKCSEYCVRMIQALREAGVHGVSYSNPVASADIITPSQFEEMALEGMAIVHAHYRASIDPFIHYAGLALYHEVSNIRRIETAYQEVKKAREDLSIINQLLTSVIDNSPLAILALDLDKRVTLWSRAAERMFGWSSEETIGSQSPVDIEASEENYSELYSNVLSGQRITGLEVERQRKDGLKLDVSLSVAPIVDTEKKVTGNDGDHW